MRYAMYYAELFVQESLDIIDFIKELRNNLKPIRAVKSYYI